ncbi:MAG TPA: carboxylating nicotinate-nucleotide diphosphorylase [Planctomycetota bacterium]|nr:carboxylating nicotinate-nucleotide diphosphorylase [Planctomycetota bacterium]
MSDVYAHPDVAAIVAFALQEDLRDAGDITCRALVPRGSRLSGVVRAKQAGVVCGLPLFAHVFRVLGGGVAVERCAADGTRVVPGDEVLRCAGDAGVMLMGERTALNLVQRLSGVASETRRYADAVAGTKAAILDTRKTTPGLRILQKHAVACAGGANHRIGLYDQALIKENHIALMPADGGSRGPAEAVRRARAALGSALIEVEIETLDDLEGVIAAGADIVLLDNCAPDVVRAAVRQRGDRRVLLEASGGITLANVRAFAETGVDRISIGALTHSSGALDLSLRCAPIA